MATLDLHKSLSVKYFRATLSAVILSASMSGVTFTITEITYGVSEEEVTFRPENYTIVKTIDKR